MNIRHPSIFNTERVEKLYSEKDGVPVKYVCTTDLSMSDVPADIFYRESPHPEFGNRYFGLYRNPDPASDGTLMITGADKVEEFQFGMIKDSDDNYYYSSSHHDCIFIEGKMIDGGREYIRSTGLDVVFKIKNGEFINV